MDVMSPADPNKPRRGRPPLLAKSARNSVSIDRFLLPGASSSTSASSASAMAGQELGTRENQNPNVIFCPSPNHTISLNQKCSPQSENAGPDKAFSSRPLKNTSSVPVMAVKEIAPSENQNPNVVSSPSSESNPSPKRTPHPNLNPISEDCPTAVLGPVPPKKASRGRPPKKASRGRPRKRPSPTSTETAMPAPHAHITPPVAETTANDAKNSKKGVKRKLSIIKGPLDAESKDSLAKEFTSELASLFKFYHEDEKIDLTMAGTNNAGRRAEVALLLEESGLPFSSLVANLLLQLKSSDNGQGGNDLTLTSLRSMVLSVGERTCFGMPNPDADVLEDDSDACLWCWEVRDIKLFPEAHRSMIAARRRKRRRIAERIAALSGIITVLTTTYDKDHEQSMLEKAEEELSKTESEDSIRAHFNQWMTAKGALREERKVALREQHRRAREIEKERRRLDKEEEKEKKRMEKEEEKKKIQLEKEKERLEKEREKLEIEASKQRLKDALRQEKELKKQQEEVEKDQKRKEKEEADLKKQSALKKQANIMDRFLQIKKEQEPVSCLPHGMRAASQSCDGASLHEKVMHDIDREMALCGERSIQDLFSSHVMAWKKHSLLPSRRNLKRWGQRREPKMAPVNELRLQGGPSSVFEGADDFQAGLGHLAGGGCKRSRTEFEESEVNAERCEADWDDSGVMDYSHLVEQNVAEDPQKVSHFHTKRRKLLQFDKSHRPAYYGSLSKKSEVVRPRNPLKMDSNLDYENDSDEEWEEEDPGESLSDCEKDEDEKPDPDEEEEAGDGFVVPDGYLSESEVAHVDESDSESDAEHSQLSPSMKVAVGSTAQPDGNHSLLKFARQCKVLEQLTNQALQHNRPYIICNFHHNRLSNLAQKTDRTCLEALKVCRLSNEIQIEVPQDPQLQEKIDDSKKPIKRPKRSLPETAIREMVEILMSSTHGLNKLIDCLSTKFPTAPRSQLRSKIREIADFVDNHWQVKKEVLEQLGMSLPCAQVASTPEPVSKSPSAQLKPITKFFSKRCLPPEIAGLDDTSPVKGKENYCAKSNVAVDVNILKSEGNTMSLVEGNPIQSM